MKFLLTALLVGLAVTLALADVTEDNLWQQYKGRHNKKYHPKDEAKRKANFLATDKRIKKHNSGNYTYEMGHNKFSDMSDGEKKARLGVQLNISLQRSLDEDHDFHFAVNDRANGPFPDSMDYRDHKCMLPVRDQGSCGSCWAFSAITSLEFNKCKMIGTPIALSEQMVVDCDSGNYGCDGGLYTKAWDFLKRIGRVRTAESYPYTSGDSGLPGTCNLSFDSYVTAPTIRISGYGKISAGNETAIKSALFRFGPIPTAIYVCPSLYDYESGIYEDSSCSYGRGQVCGAGVIVGYGATSDPTPIPYWVVRNSWGPDWGLDGHFLVKRGVNMANIETYAAYINVD